MKILILGGYGTFGGRLAELLCDIPDLHLQICGRDIGKATAFCATLSGHATHHAFDRADLAKHIKTLAPDLVVDASGPFQDYGDARYSVIETCIAAQTDYMDFADAADFVFGVSAFDQAAKDAGIYVLSGVSSFPVLTAAVLREIAKEFPITDVTGGIAPSPYAGIGLNVMRAVVGYAGGPVKLTRNGQQTTALGLTESRRYTIAVPGKTPLNNIRFSLVDVPDLQVLPPAHPSLQNIWMGAGPVPEFLHRALNMLAIARAKLGLPSLTPLSPLFHRILNLMKFGEHRGGMYIHAKGDSAEMSWHLLAEGDDGPYIPSMSIEALVRKQLRGTRPENGARPATAALTLAELDAVFAGKTITTGFRRPLPRTAPLYRHILGDAFDMLPPQVRALHDDTTSRTWQGTGSVRRGTGFLANIIGALFGFPKTTEATSVTVDFDYKDGVETWRRAFGAHKFHSVQSRGAGRKTHLLMERFGPITAALAVTIADDRLYLIPRHWSFLGLPLPKFLMPAGNSFETEIDGKFAFDVEIAAPFIGLIAAYRGQLTRTV